MTPTQGIGIRQFLLTICVALTCSLGTVYAQDSSSSSSSTGDSKVQSDKKEATKDVGAAKKELGKAKKEAGLVKKLFKKLEGYMSDVKKKEEQKGVKDRADKRNYEHHYTHLKHKDLSTSSTQSSIGAKDSMSTTPFKHDPDAKLSYEVFGWHPSWMKDAYKAYNFHLLSMIGFFSYEVDPATGQSKSFDTDGFKNIIEAAKQSGSGCKVLVTINNFGADANAQFLRNTKAQQTLITNIVKLIVEDSAHGVSIDFEGVPVHYKSEYSSFLTNLTQAVHKANKDYIVSLTLYPIDEEDLYDFKILNRTIDNFVMMGYDYYGAFSKTAGPVAPLQSGKIWWTWNLERSIEEYITQGVDVSRFLVAFPYYGAIWETDGLEVPSNAKKFIGHKSYQYIMNAFENDRVSIDSVSKSAFFAYPVGGTSETRQCWFDNVESLRTKYNYVRSKKLAGIGIWALGFDNGRDELWQLLQEEFASGKGAPEDTTAQASDSTAAAGDGGGDGGDDAAAGGDGVSPDSLEEAIQLMFRYRALTLLLLAYLIMLVGTAFVVAIADYRTRAYFVNFSAFRVYYMAFFFLVALLFLRLLNVFDNGSFLVLAGLIVGAGISVLVNRLLQRKKKMLP